MIINQCYFIVFLEGTDPAPKLACAGLNVLMCLLSAQPLPSLCRGGAPAPPRTSKQEKNPMVTDLRSSGTIGFPKSEVMDGNGVMDGTLLASASPAAESMHPMPLGRSAPYKHSGARVIAWSFWVCSTMHHQRNSVSFTAQYYKFSNHTASSLARQWFRSDLLQQYGRLRTYGRPDRLEAKMLRRKQQKRQQI